MVCGLLSRASMRLVVAVLLACGLVALAPPVARAGRAAPLRITI